MGFSFFVCRVTGKVSTDANQLNIILENGKWRYPKEDEECGIYSCDDGLAEKKSNDGELLINEDEYISLVSDVDKAFGYKYISCRIMDVWDEFWNTMDEWEDDRENNELIEWISGYLYG